MRFTPTISDLVHSPIGAAHALLAHRVHDRPLLDLSQAAPAYAPPPAVLDAVSSGTTDRITTTYAPQPGLPGLRAAFAADLTDSYGARVDSADVLITAGCNQAFCIAASALAGPGDNVVLQTPFYFNHDMWLRVEGIEPRYLRPDDRLLPSPETASGLLDDRTRACWTGSKPRPTGGGSCRCLTPTRRATRPTATCARWACGSGAKSGHWSPGASCGTTSGCFASTGSAR